MNDLSARIDAMFEFEDVSVNMTTYENMMGHTMNNYAVNKGGVVQEFAIQAEEDDEGVLEDFLQYIEAAVSEIGART